MNLEAAPFTDVPQKEHGISDEDLASFTRILSDFCRALGSHSLAHLKRLLFRRFSGREINVVVYGQK